MDHEAPERVVGSIDVMRLVQPPGTQGWIGKTDAPAHHRDRFICDLPEDHTFRRHSQLPAFLRLPTATCGFPRLKPCSLSVATDRPSRSTRKIRAGGLQAVKCVLGPSRGLFTLIAWDAACKNDDRLKPNELPRHRPQVASGGELEAMPNVCRGLQVTAVGRM